MTGYRKTHQLFSVHSTPEKFENSTIIGHLGFVFEEDSARENHMNIVTFLFSKSSVFRMLSVHAKKHKAGAFKSLRFEEVFEKLHFRDRLAWKVGLIGERKLRFQISTA